MRKTKVKINYRTKKKKGKNPLSENNIYFKMLDYEGFFICDDAVVCFNVPESFLKTREWEMVWKNFRDFNIDITKVSCKSQWEQQVQDIRFVLELSSHDLLLLESLKFWERFLIQVVRHIEDRHLLRLKHQH